MLYTHTLIKVPLYIYTERGGHESEGHETNTRADDIVGGKFKRGNAPALY